MNFHNFLKKSHVNFLIINMLVGILLYLSLITQQLTNHLDGLWSDPWYEAGKWELSIGRWFWLFLDRFRVGYAADPFNSYLALLFLVVGNMLVLDIFCLLETRKAYLISAMILSSTTVCVFLTYRYMSPTFGLGYLLSIASVWFLCKLENRWFSFMMSSGSLCLSLGLYQANIGCTCLLIIIVLLVFCFDQDNEKQLVIFLFKSGFSVVTACIIYKLLWDFFMWYFHVSPSSYNGAANISVISIAKGLPASIIAAYRQFFSYFLGNNIKHNIFQTSYFFPTIFLFLAIVLVRKGLFLLKMREVHKCIFYLIMIFLIPVACNVGMLLAPEAGFMIQQTVAMAILLPVMLCLIVRLYGGNTRTQQMIKYCAIGLSGLILYGNIYMTAMDLENLQEGKKASDTVMNHVVQTLIDEGLYDNERIYIFVGRLSDNHMFRAPIFWEKCNNYTHYGEFWMLGGNVWMAYNGLLRNAGIALLVGPDEMYQYYISLDEVVNMPMYPEKNSIRDMGDCIIIKMSNIY